MSEQTMMIVMLLVAALQPDPENPRQVKDDDSLRDLAADIKRRGVLVPVLVRKNGEVYVIVDGHRRHAAAVLAGLERVPCIVLSKDVSEAQIRETQLVTQLHSQALTPYEVYAGIQNWLPLHPGATNKDVATAISRSEGLVSMTLSLSKCIKQVQDAAAAGKIGLKDWYAMSTGSDEQQLAMLIAKLSGASRTEVEATKRQARNGSQAKETTSRIKVEVASGIMVSFTGKEAFGVEEAIKAANEAAKLMKEGQVKGLSLKNIQKGTGKAGA